MNVTNEVQDIILVEETLIYSFRWPEVTTLHADCSLSAIQSLSAPLLGFAFGSLACTAAL